MTLKNIFKLALFSFLLNSSAVLAADNSAVLGKWTLDMSVQGLMLRVMTIAEDGDGQSTWVGPAATNTLSDVEV